MIGNIDKKTAHFIVETGFLKKEENITEEILIFGCNIFLNTIISWIFLLVIAVGIERFSEAIIYIVVFSLLRGYAGGYHAANELYCIGTYIGLFCASGLLECVLINVIYVLEWITICMGLILCLIVPVGTANNPIPKLCKRVKRKKLFLIICIGVLFYISIFRVRYQYYTLCAVFWCGILLFTGKAQEYVKKKSRNTKS